MGFSVKRSKTLQNLRLIAFRISKFEFQFVEGIENGTAFNIIPEIECKVGKKGKELKVFLNAKVGEMLSNPVPFKLNVVMVADFAIVNEVSNGEYVKEAFEELYPFLRSSIAGAMVNFNVQPYFLPFISSKTVSQEEKPVGDLN